MVSATVPRPGVTMLSLTGCDVLPDEKYIFLMIVFFVYKMDQELTGFEQRKSTHTGICMDPSINRLFLFLER